MHLLNHSSTIHEYISNCQSLSFLWRISSCGAIEFAPRLDTAWKIHRLSPNSYKIRMFGWYEPSLTPSRCGYVLYSKAVLCSAVQCCAVLCSAVQICMWKCSIIESLDRLQPKQDQWLYTRKELCFVFLVFLQVKIQAKKDRASDISHEDGKSDSWTIQHASHKCQLQP